MRMVKTIQFWVTKLWLDVMATVYILSWQLIRGNVHLSSNCIAVACLLSWQLLCITHLLSHDLQWGTGFSASGVSLKATKSGAAMMAWHLYRFQTLPFLHNFVHVCTVTSHYRTLTFPKWILWMCHWTMCNHFHYKHSNSRTNSSSA